MRKCAGWLCEPPIDILGQFDSVRSESVFDPVYGEFPLVVSQRNYVKATGLPGAVALQLQVSLCGVDDASLLGPGDTFGATSIPCLTAVADFSKYQAFSIFHDQVDLTQPAMEIPRYGFKAVVAEKFFCFTFKMVTYFSF